MPQLQHHLYAWGAERLLFSVIVGNQEPERLWIGASSEYISHYVSRCDAFWQHMREDRAPSPAFFGASSEVKVPQAVKDSVPINGFKRRDISMDNMAQALIPEFIETKKAAQRHEQIKDDLKALMKPDEAELYSPQITLKRDKRGAIRITVKDEDGKKAA